MDSNLLPDLYPVRKLKKIEGYTGFRLAMSERGSNGLAVSEWGVQMGSQRVHPLYSFLDIWL